MECSICGISDKMRDVSQALSSKGIVLACDRCVRNEGFILMKKPRIIEEKARESVYERMARLAGVVPKEQSERPWLRKQEKSLREIVDKNYEKKMTANKEIVLKPRQDLVDNFHWIIMRVRRVKGLTQGQLAERITEPEAAVKMAEQGVVPEGYKLIDKLQHFLGVRLIKQRDLSLPLQRQKEHIQRQLNPPLNQSTNQLQQVYQQKEQTSSESKTLGFDRHSLGFLTIADLKKMKQEEEKGQNEQVKNETAEEELEKQEDKEQSRLYDRLDYE